MRATPHVLLGLFAGSIALALYGCGDSDCLGGAGPSVRIEVQDENGNPVLDADVTYTLDGSEAQTATCQPSEGGCIGFLAGTEQQGHYVVRAESADGTKETELAVDVDGFDGCHVIAKKVTLVL